MASPNLPRACVLHAQHRRQTHDHSPACSVVLLGLGVISYPVAGYQVTVYERTASKSVAWC